METTQQIFVERMKIYGCGVFSLTCSSAVSLGLEGCKIKNTSLDFKKKERKKGKTHENKTKDTGTHPPKSSKCYYSSISPQMQKSVKEIQVRDGYG